MKKCIKCGKEAIFTKPYLIGQQEGFSIKLEGAAVVSVCGDCIKPYLKKQINKNLLIAIGALVFGLFMLLAVVTSNFGSGGTYKSVSPMWVIAIIIVCLGGSIKYFLSYGLAMKKLLRKDSAFIKEVITDDFVAKLVFKAIENTGQISDNVIFNWSVLNNKRGYVASDFANPYFIAEIRMPIKALTNVRLCNIPNFSLTFRDGMLGVIMDKSLDKEGKELIIQAVECYKNES